MFAEMETAYKEEEVSGILCKLYKSKLNAQKDRNV